MTNPVKISKEELVQWLNKHAGDWAGIYAKNGVIGIFDHETGEHLAEISVDTMLTNDFVTLKFEGDKAAEATAALRINLLDGGLDQTIEGNLNDQGLDVELGDFDDATMTQMFKSS